MKVEFNLIMNSKSEKDFNYLIDCNLSDLLSKSDSIRKQLFQLNASRKQLPTDEEYNQLRHQLMIDLFKSLDQNKEKNTFLSESLIDSISGSNDRSFDSLLYRLNAKQLNQTIGLKSHQMNKSNDCHVMDIIIKTNPNEDSSPLQTKLLSKVGLFGDRSKGFI